MRIQKDFDVNASEVMGILYQLLLAYPQDIYHGIPVNMVQEVQHCLVGHGKRHLYGECRPRQDPFSSTPGLTVQYPD